MAEIRSKGAIGHVGRRRTGSSLGKIFKNTRGLRRPRHPPLPSPLPALFFSRIAFYVPPPFFQSPRIFFLPLGRPSAATEGAAKMHRTSGVGLRTEKMKKDARTVRRQTRDDLSNVKRRMHLGGKKTDGEQRENQGSPSSGGNGLRPSLRSQLVAL